MAAALLTGCAPTPPPVPVEPEIGSPAERIERWRAATPDEDLPAAVSFSAAVTFTDARDFLDRHDLRPYAIHLRVAGLTGAPYVSPGAASEELLDAARVQAFETVLNTLCDPESTLARLRRPPPLTPSDSVAEARLYSDLLRRLELSRLSLLELRSDAPLIYGMKLVGSADEISSLAEDALVARVEPGTRFRIGGAERVVVPDPIRLATDSIPAQIASVEPPRWEDARARLEHAFDERPGECTGWDARQAELRQNRSLGRS